ncbi:MAG: PAS domain S-box protein, partial [Bilophila wadsworthia]
MEYDALKQPDRITHEYNMLMSSMHVSVGKHLLDPYFTVIWANDFFYEKTGYGREEYEATFHNHVSEYYSAFPDVYETMGKFIKTALKHGEPSYEFVCPMPVKGGSRIWIKVVGTFTKETVDGIPVIYSVFTDITDLVQAQTEKSITYDNLPGF